MSTATSVLVVAFTVCSIAAVGISLTAELFVIVLGVYVSCKIISSEA